MYEQLQHAAAVWTSTSLLLKCMLPCTTCMQVHLRAASIKGMWCIQSQQGSAWPSLSLLHASVRWPGMRAEVNCHATRRPLALDIPLRPLQASLSSGQAKATGPQAAHLPPSLTVSQMTLPTPHLQAPSLPP